MDELLAWRKEFPILSNTTYMISHSLGAMPERTRARMREFTDTWTTRLIQLAEEAGFPVNTCRHPAQRGGVVVLDVPDGQEVTRQLARRQILVDYRPRAGIRVAPHFDTTDEELEHTVSEIRSIVSAGVHA